MNWLADLVPGATELSATKAGDAERLAAELASIGLEEEELFGPEITGPLVVARVLELEPEKHSNGKTVNWCRVDTGEAEPRGIVCGAHNFAAGDLVVAALPGAVLPGDFRIAARKTYGHVSDGMICSARELGLGDDHDGIIVLADLGLSGEAGDDATVLLGLDQHTLDVNVTPDRGYEYSIRGVAREYAGLKGIPFTDPAAVDVPDAASLPDAVAVTLADDAPIHDVPGCDRFAVRIVRGLDATTPTPYWMRHRLLQAGMRSISLIVDVTNYVMLETGQPLHGYDADLLHGGITVRRARSGETLTTLDDKTRTLDPEDLLITDSGGDRILGMAGVMGGADTEVGDDTSAVAIEAAHFEPVTVARTSRRHRLSSEASRRYERGVDHALAPHAAELAVRLLVRYGGGSADDAATDVDERIPAAPVRMALGLPAAIVGVDYSEDDVVRLLEATGTRVEREGDELALTAPSWRQDLVRPVDYVEEVARLGGYSSIPSVLPSARKGTGLTASQRYRRNASNLLADLGITEVLTYPFTSAGRHDDFQLDSDDPRRFNFRLANPIADDQPLMRTSLLATLVDAAVRNIGRGNKDVAVFETGLVTVPVERTVRKAPRYAPGYFPSDDERAAVFDAVPPQPRHLAAVLTGRLDAAGWWGPGRPADAHDAIELTRRLAGVAGVDAIVESADRAPFHPGRCARVTLPSGAEFGYAGELHPKVCESLDLPARTVAFEVNLDVVTAEPSATKDTGVLSTYPAATQDIALIVGRDVPAAHVTEALRDGAGDLLETVHLFDLYEGEQVGEYRKSLAYRLTFRAPDRTLTADEATRARQAAAEQAIARFGAEVRGA
ncbi:phenylalanine--tRNA ligase subunit beta [Spelaeicoccus albus]|uniref:Phenylalanine--tRNA ligase beta subunit n=2 Tax=Spelaeicoccus albus TaxID=1280376 RepID=A0A7Z0IHM4_9MICO|nr:phenylalanine--tRNA ligase subunit beta [Spelaeicoccus albus]NYI67848.1 phenylalanyl-tRNA synthetase beta chain [Spelaeicoccus albus]